MKLVDEIRQVILPANARVEHRDQHVGSAGGHLPGTVDAGAFYPKELLWIAIDCGFASLLTGQFPVVGIEIVRECERRGLREEQVARKGGGRQAPRRALRSHAWGWI